MPSIGDNDPIVVLSEHILDLFQGQRIDVIVAALATCLAITLRRGEAAGVSTAATHDLTSTLEQIVAEILARRAGHVYGQH